MELKEWLSKERGRQAAIARHLSISPVTVGEWSRKERPIPVAHMAAIEAFTDGLVTRRDMRPDDWKSIWPELAAVRGYPNRVGGLSVVWSRDATVTNREL